MDTQAKSKIDSAAESLDLSTDDWDVVEGVFALLTERAEWKKLERAHRVVLRQATTSQAASLGGLPRLERERALWHALGRIYRDRLGDDASALEALELCSRYGRDAAVRFEIAALHQKAGRYDTAVGVYEEMIALAPTRADTYERLCELHAQQGEIDRAWCAAAALVLLDEATAGVHRFYEARRPRLLPARTGGLDDAAFEKLRHPDEEPLLCEVLRWAAPLAPVGGAEQPPIEENVVGWASEALGLPHPTAYIAPRANLEEVDAGHTLGERLFLAARRATSRRSAHYAFADARLPRLKRTLFAAARLIGRDVSAPGESPEVVAEAKAMLERGLSADQRTRLEAAVRALFVEGGAVDFVRWRRAVALTRLRAGLLVCVDPCGVKRLLVQPDDVLGADEKLAAAAAFTASTLHAELRARLGYALGARAAPAAPSSPQTAPVPTARLVNTLAEARSRTVGALCAVLGVSLDAVDPSALSVSYGQGRLAVPGLTAYFAADDGAPATIEALRGRRLVEWTMTLAKGLVDVEHVLVARFGAPMTFQGGRQYGPFTVMRDGAPDVGSLAHRAFASVPNVPLGLVAERPDGELVAVADEGARLRLWSPAQARVTAFHTPGFPVCGLAWTHDGQTLLVWTPRVDTLRRFSADGAKHIDSLITRHGAGAIGLAVHPSRQVAATTGADGQVRVWDLATGKATLEVKDEAIDGVTIELSETHVLVGLRSGGSASWDLATGARAAEQTAKNVTRAVAFAREHDATSACFVPQTKLVVTSHADGRLHVWKEHDGATAKIGEVAFDDDVPRVVDVADPALWWANASKHEEPVKPTNETTRLVTAAPAAPLPPREHAIVTLARACAAAPDVAGLAHAAASLPRDGGVVYRSDWNGRTSVAFEVSPPLDALSLARMLGWRDAVAQAFAGALNEWHVRLVAGQDAYGPIAMMPMFGPWPVYAGLANRPSGGRIAADASVIVTHALGAGDVVRTLRIGEMG